MDKMEKLIKPNNIALVGASSNLQKSAGRVLVNFLKSNLIQNLFIVNPNHEDILGIKSYPTVLDIDEEIDLVCIIVPAMKVPAILKQCVAKRVKAVTILGMGFSEVGEIGKQLEEEVISIIDQEDIVVYGPNSPGYFDYKNQWGVSFSPNFEPKQMHAGNVGLISHGGSLGRAVLDANEKGIGFSYWFSPGNELDVTVNDCLEFLIEDDDTEVILLVLESSNDSERFFNLIHRAYEKNKPVIVLSVGHTENSIPAIKQHLGTDVKTVFPWETVQHPGLIKVASINELVSLAWLFNYYRNSKGNRSLIYSWTGGISIYLADLCAKHKVQLPNLSNTLQRQLKDLIKLKNHYINPLDLTTEVYEDVTIFHKSLQMIIESKEYDNIIVIFPFQLDYKNEVLAKEVIEISKDSNIVIVPVFLSQGYNDQLGLEIIKKGKIPYFLNENSALKVLSQFISYKDDE